MEDAGAIALRVVDSAGATVQDITLRVFIPVSDEAVEFWFRYSAIASKKLAGMLYMMFDGTIPSKNAELAWADGTLYGLPPGNYELELTRGKKNMRVPCVIPEKGEAILTPIWQAK